MWPSWYCIGLKYLWYYRTNCNDSITRVVGILQVPTGHLKDILLQAKRITGIESTQIRWFSRWSGGEAGPVEHSSAEAKSLKTKGQGAVRLPPQWATTEATRRGARGPNKELLSQQFTKRKQSLKQLWPEASWVKGIPPKKATIEKRERRLLYAPILKLQKGMMSGLLKSVMNENQNSQSQVHVIVVRCLRF